LSAEERPGYLAEMASLTEEESHRWYDAKDRSPMRAHARRRRFEAILQRSRAARVLVFGERSGDLSWRLAAAGRSVCAVVGSRFFESRVRRRAPVAGDLQVQRMDLEKDVLEGVHPEIVVSDILEHVGCAESVLGRLREHLEPEGRLHVVVPNARSLHRRIGMEMGLLAELTGISPVDRAAGHHRIYTEELLRAHLEGAGFRIAERQGLTLRFLTVAQVDAFVREQPGGERFIAACDALTPDLEAWASELYVLARPGGADAR